MKFTVYSYIYPGLVSGPLTMQYGPRPVAAAGAFLSGLGLFISAFAQKLWLLYFSFGILTGQLSLINLVESINQVLASYQVVVRVGWRQKIQVVLSFIVILFVPIYFNSTLLNFS